MAAGALRGFFLWRAVAAYGLLASPLGSFEVLNDTDWLDARVSDDPVLPVAASLHECAALCAARADCVAVSWTDPASASISPLYRQVCSLKCSAPASRRVRRAGQLGAIIRPNRTVCPGPGWHPAEWRAEAETDSLLIAGPKQEGGRVGNGYVAAWIKSLVGTSGPVQSGVEHLVGVFAGRNTAEKPAGCVSWCDRAHKADIPSFTSTAQVSALRGEAQPTTATALDLRRGAFLRASATQDHLAHCVQTVFAHRVLKHVLVSEFRCDNEHPSLPAEVQLEQPGPSPISAPTAELTNASAESGLPGVACSKMTVKVAESDGGMHATIAECHSECHGARFMLAPGTKGVFFACISSRYTTVDDLGPPADARVPPGADPTSLAIGGWIEANASAEALAGSHAAAMGELLRPGIEVVGDRNLARIVNSSMASLFNTYRADVSFGGASSGGLESDAYAGGTGGGWDIETWQFPVLLAFYPDLARSVLQYRADRQAAAAANARRSRGPPTLEHNVSFEGLMYPWMTALSGADNGGPGAGWPTEDHLNGDISLAFQQYWHATQNVSWLRTTGFSVIEGIARFWASKCVRNTDGSFSIPQTQSPDEYHTNVTDAVFTNAVARIALLGAHDLALAAGKVPNASFKHIAEHLRILYDADGGYHPAFAGFDPFAPDAKIKQADVILLAYPLQVDLPAHTLRRDLDIYARITDPYGPAMTWMIYSIAYGDIGDDEQAAHYFRKSWEAFVQGPFYVWHESINLQGGVPNFVNGAGMLLMSVVAGYGGVRWSGDALLLRRPRPPPNCTKLVLRRVSWRGARINLEATGAAWSVALDEPMQEGAGSLLLEVEGHPPRALTAHPSSWPAGTSARVVATARAAPHGSRRELLV